MLQQKRIDSEYCCIIRDSNVTYNRTNVLRGCSTLEAYGRAQHDAANVVTVGRRGRIETPAEAEARERACLFLLVLEYAFCV